MGEAKRRSQFKNMQFVRLTEMLHSHGVNTDEFAFYDQPSFIEQEKYQPEYLEHYAKWVLLRPTTDTYQFHVRSVVPRLSQLISTALMEDQWEGSCILATGLMTRMLDRLNVWSFGIRGSATFSVQERSIWRGLHSVDVEDFPGAALGHAWVCAPPYIVVDASAATQRWGDDPIRKYIPSFILDDSGLRTKPIVSDVVSAPIRARYALTEGREDQNLHYRLESRLRDFGKTFPATKVPLGPLVARYIPIAITQSDVDLENINKGGGVGRTGEELWQDVVRPQLLRS